MAKSHVDGMGLSDDLVIKIHPGSSYKNNSFRFDPAQAFFSFCTAPAKSSLLTALACSGQMLTHRIQLIHFLLSVCAGSSAGIALTGHLSAHRPQPVQFFPALGVRGIV